MFSRSYAPSYVLEQAANNGDESSLLPAARTPPPELTTMPDAIEMISEHQADTVLAVIEAQVELQEVEIAQVEEAQAALPKPGPSRRSFASMASIVGNALFSSCESSARASAIAATESLSILSQTYCCPRVCAWSKAPVVAYWPEQRSMSHSKASSQITVSSKCGSSSVSRPWRGHSVGPTGGTTTTHAQSSQCYP